MKQYKEEELAAGDDLTPLQTPEERAELIKQGKDPDGKKPGSHRGRPFVHMEQMYVIQDPKMFQAIIKNPLSSSTTTRCGAATASPSMTGTKTSVNGLSRDTAKTREPKWSAPCAATTSRWL